MFFYPDNWDHCLFIDSSLISVTISKTFYSWDPSKKTSPKDGFFWNRLFGRFVICLPRFLHSAWPSCSLQPFYILDNWQFAELIVHVAHYFRVTPQFAQNTTSFCRIGNGSCHAWAMWNFKARFFARFVTPSSPTRAPPRALGLWTWQRGEAAAQDWNSQWHASLTSRKRLRPWSGRWQNDGAIMIWSKIFS